jgi:hypothetical protein
MMLICDFFAATLEIVQPSGRAARSRNQLYATLFGLSIVFSSDVDISLLTIQTILILTFLRLC